MASLYNQSIEQRYYLKHHTTLGRFGPSVEILVENPEVSKIHATIEWNKEQWLIKDLSSNGTWLNDEKIARNLAMPIKEGDVIRLASKDGYALQIEDLDAPCDMLIPVSEDGASDNQVEPIALESYNLIPSIDEPKVSLVYLPSLSSWMLEVIGDDNPEKYPVIDKQVITIAGRQWRMQANDECAATALLSPEHNSISDVCFHFDVSQDEETTRLRLVIQDSSVDLKVRMHHYLALLLARKRLEDQKQGINEASQGWVYAEQLGCDLGIDACHVNIQIHRLRKQVSDSLPQLNDLENLIERQAGQLRLGSAHIQIVKGGELEA